MAKDYYLRGDTSFRGHKGQVSDVMILLDWMKQIFSLLCLERFGRNNGKCMPYTLHRLTLLVFPIVPFSLGKTANLGKIKMEMGA